jgi:glycosyltransferase involved in cell wall biosynthesis
MKNYIRGWHDDTIALHSSRLAPRAYPRMKPPLRVIALTKDDPQYGGHSGYYTQAFRFPPCANLRVRAVMPRAGWLPRVVGKALSLRHGISHRNQAEQTAETEFLALSWLDRGAVGHVANIEDHLPLIRALRAEKPRWVATVHFPAPHWRKEDARALRHFGKIIVLCRRDAQAFAQWLPAERIAFIPHGVDTTFFQHNAMARSTSPRVMFVGKWLRDFETAGEVLFAALAQWPQLGADIVVSRHWAAGSRLAGLSGHPRVRWHEAVDDYTLRQLYQAAWLLLMPLHETSANNALVEALACGTVPVVNNIGGVADYGGGEVFPMSESNDPTRYLGLMEEYFNNSKKLAECSRNCQAFAIDRLDWRLIRARNRGVYEDALRQ